MAELVSIIRTSCPIFVPLKCFNQELMFNIMTFTDEISKKAEKYDNSPKGRQFIPFSSKSNFRSNSLTHRTSESPRLVTITWHYESAILYSIELQKKTA